MRVGRADEGDVERTRKLEALDVLPRSNEEAAILDPEDASSDHAGHRQLVSHADESGDLTWCTSSEIRLLHDAAASVMPTVNRVIGASHVASPER